MTESIRSQPFTWASRTSTKSAPAGMLSPPRRLPLSARTSALEGIASLFAVRAVNGGYRG
jgi:hypothetical protein